MTNHKSFVNINEPRLHTHVEISTNICGVVFILFITKQTWADPLIFVEHPTTRMDESRIELSTISLHHIR